MKVQHGSWRYLFLSVTKDWNLPTATYTEDGLFSILWGNLGTFHEARKSSQTRNMSANVFLFCLSTVSFTQASTRGLFSNSTILEFTKLLPYYGSLIRNALGKVFFQFGNTDYRLVQGLYQPLQFFYYHIWKTLCCELYRVQFFLNIWLT